MASKSDKDTADDPVIRPFADYIREQAKGATHEELSEKLHELVNAVVETGKKGTLTLQITVDHVKKAEAHVLQVTDRVVMKAPEHDRQVSVFFSDHGNLSRNNPEQPALGIKGLAGGRDDAERAEVRA